MNRQQTTPLDAVAVQVKRARSFAGYAQLAAEADPVRAEDMARQAGEAAESALQGLLALGATRPGPAIARDAVPLHLLDTPATRRLLALLAQVAEAGAEVDRERGWVDAQGEPIGFGESFGNEYERLRGEVVGPSGLD